MKAISLWQPWATLVAVGNKHETRSWGTSYRGDVLICSTKTTPRDVFAKATTDPKIYSRMACWGHTIRKEWPESYPHGVALAVVELFDCLPADEWKANALADERPEQIQNQREMGDIDSPGRFVWVFRNRRRLKTLVPQKGHQGLWHSVVENEHLAGLFA